MGIPYTIFNKEFRDKYRLELYRKNKQRNAAQSTSSRSQSIKSALQSIRPTTKKNPLPWVKASGPATVRLDKATYYLVHTFDYATYRPFDDSVMILSKVVCNLRHYFCQSQESTVKLVQEHFNPKSDDKWSPEGIRLVWELAEPFTPDLGLVDAVALAQQKKVFLENEVVDLIAWTKPGGRVLDKDLLKVFREWNPELEIEFTENLFTRAVQAVTGLRKLRSNGKDYWVGFHLPAADEQLSEVA